MQVVFKFIRNGILVLLLFCVIANPAYGQVNKNNPKNKKTAVIPADTTLKQPAPIRLIFTENCLKGISEVLVKADTVDTFAIPRWLYVYVLTDNAADSDSIPGQDSLYFHKVFNFSDIEKNNHRLYVDVAGRYYVKPATGSQTHPFFGKPSNIVDVRFCSKIDFPPVFDRATQKIYSPGPFINVQIAEFDIFDRMGNTVYSHKNNDIHWDGTYPTRQPCAAGIYYFSCSYVDMTDDNRTKKSLSGMIELKN